ncbi:putative head completion protein (T4 gp41-like) [Campylobacter phage CP21]|uniref:Head completion protein (T4 gp41-like) n=1 Tax=Campylobacter phage CP21 TaxID=2881391 RepID=I7JC38_9CAUD|nr:putative head completion protein (T4 gp41-like) [Campylobacter phage CP21]CCH63555.1 putative head completion protein (T4 gp41-like) [Campylobacter phage CP21]
MKSNTDFREVKTKFSIMMLLDNSNLTESGLYFNFGLI